LEKGRRLRSRSRCGLADEGRAKYRDMGMTYWLEKAETEMGGVGMTVLGTA
jgi:hypothetical protein